MSRGYFAACLFVVLVLPLSADQLRWAPITGAGGYLVEVRSKTDTVTAKVTDPAYELSLAPGDYELRITTLDKFLKPATSTAWMSFAVVKAVTPTVSAITPAVLQPGEKPNFVVDGAGFSSATEVLLVDAAQTEIKARPRALSGHQLAFTVAEPLRPGSYSLVVRNPPGQRASLNAGLMVLAPELPNTPERVPEPLPTTPERAPIAPTRPLSPSVPVRLGARYGVAIPLGPWSSLIGPSYQNGSVSAQWPAWGTVGPVVQIDYAGFNSQTGVGLASSRLNAEDLAAGVYWEPAELPVKLWLAPGVAFTQATSAGTQTTSLDPSLAGGLGVVFWPSNQVFLELGAEYHILFYTDTPLQSVGASVTSGIRF